MAMPPHVTPRYLALAVCILVVFAHTVFITTLLRERYAQNNISSNRSYHLLDPIHQLFHRSQPTSTFNATNPKSPLYLSASLLSPFAAAFENEDASQVLVKRNDKVKKCISDIKDVGWEIWLIVSVVGISSLFALLWLLRLCIKDRHARKNQQPNGKNQKVSERGSFSVPITGRQCSVREFKDKEMSERKLKEYGLKIRPDSETSDRDFGDKGEYTIGGSHGGFRKPLRGISSLPELGDAAYGVPGGSKSGTKHLGEWALVEQYGTAVPEIINTKASMSEVSASGGKEDSLMMRGDGTEDRKAVGMSSRTSPRRVSVKEGKMAIRNQENGLDHARDHPSSILSEPQLRTRGKSDSSQSFMDAVESHEHPHITLEHPVIDIAVKS